MVVVAEAWTRLAPVHEFLLAVLLTLVTAGLLAMFRPKVRLTWGSTSLNYHRFTLSNEAAPVTVTTEKLFVQNIGRKAASNIELILNDEPTSYTLWSPREHKRGLLTNGGFFIKIETLAPGELLIVDTIDVGSRNPRLVNVNCPDTLTKQVNFAPQRQFGRLFTAAVFYLMFAGLVGSIYLLLLILLSL